MNKAISAIPYLQYDEFSKDCPDLSAKVSYLLAPSVQHAADSCQQMDTSKETFHLHMARSMAYPRGTIDLLLPQISISLSR